MQGGSGAKLADGEDVGLHIIDKSTDALVLALCVVVGFVAVGKAALVVAIIQQVVLHHGEGVLGHGRPCHTNRDEK